MNVQLLAIAALATSLLVGCGGGGSSTPSSTPPVTQSSSSSSEPSPLPAEKSSLLIMANLSEGYVIADYVDVQLEGQSTVSEELNPMYLSMPAHPIVPWVALSDVEVGEYTATLSLYRYNRETDEPELVASGQGDFVHVIDDSEVTIQVARTIPVPPLNHGFGGMFQDIGRDVYEVNVNNDGAELSLLDVDSSIFAEVVSADVDQDGYMIGTLRRSQTNAGSDSYVMRIDPYNGDYDVLFDAEERLNALAVNSENEVFALSWYDAWLALNGEEVSQTLYHYTMDGDLLHKVEIDRLIRGIDFHPDGRLIGINKNKIYTISPDSGETTILYEYEFGGGSDIDISQDGILRTVYAPVFPEVVCNQCIKWSEIDLESGDIVHSIIYEDQPVTLTDNFLIYR